MIPMNMKRDASPLTILDSVVSCDLVFALAADVRRLFAFYALCEF